MSRVFISHSHRDRGFVKKLSSDLRAAGHATWVDDAELGVGDSLVQRIAEALHEVDFVIAVISGGSVESAWVQQELDLAAAREMTENTIIVLPLLLEAVEMPPFLRSKRYADFTSPRKYSTSFKQLLAAMKLPRRAKESEGGGTTAHRLLGFE